MPGWSAGLVRLGVLAGSVLSLSSCTPPAEFVVAMTTDPQGRLALIVEACDDNALTARIWLRDENGPPYPHASAVSATGTALRPVSTPGDLAELTVFTGPIRIGEPVVVPLLEPSAAEWTAEPPVTALTPHRRYSVSRDAMSALDFNTDWFTEEPLNRPGAITAGSTTLDGRPNDVIDVSEWPRYVGQVCR